MERDVSGEMASSSHKLSCRFRPARWICSTLLNPTWLCLLESPLKCAASILRDQLQVACFRAPCLCHLLRSISHGILSAVIKTTLKQFVDCNGDYCQCWSSDDVSSPCSFSKMWYLKGSRTKRILQWCSSQMTTTIYTRIHLSIGEYSIKLFAWFRTMSPSENLSLSSSHVL